MKRPSQPRKKLNQSRTSTRSAPADTLIQPAGLDEPWTYEIRIKGYLDTKWSDWFGGMTIALEDAGTTLLRGPVIDQACLHGLLAKVRDLGMPLLLVKRVHPDCAA